MADLILLQRSSRVSTPPFFLNQQSTRAGTAHLTLRHTQCQSARSIGLTLKSLQAGFCNL